MKPIKLTESDISYFIKPSTVGDAEVFLNGAILIRKHIDMANGVMKDYGLKLMDNPPEEKVACYKVASNSIGNESKRNFINKHRVEDCGEESSNSIYLVAVEL